MQEFIINGHGVAGMACECLHFGPLGHYVTLATLTQDMKNLCLLLCFKICTLALVFHQSSKSSPKPSFSSLPSFFLSAMWHAGS